MERVLELLKACRDLLNKQNKTIYVLNMLTETVHYGGTECDGYCLLEDIKCYFEEAEAEEALEKMKGKSNET